MFGALGTQRFEPAHPKWRTPRAGWFYQGFLALSLLLILVAGGAVGLSLLAGERAGDPQRLPALSPEKLEQVNDLSDAFQYVIQQMQPSVVSITATRRLGGGQPEDQARVPEHLREFFGDDFFERFFRQQQPHSDMLQRGVGTGVIISENGYILTNAHVVQSADRVQVTLSDKRSMDAQVIGRDAQTDLAVLKIKAGQLVPAKLGDSGVAHPGQWVLAFGSPFELHQSVTAGIISATGRANVGIVEYEDFIQTDAAINPGNSGGPLVNLRGEVIGITTAIATRSGGYMGIGFAIPSNLATSITDQLIKTGEVRRGRLGILIQELTEDLARSFGFKDKEGVLISDVVPGGPAADAGLQSGDILLDIDGEPTRSAIEVHSRVARIQPGTKVEVTVFRNGEQKTVPVTVGLLESKPAETAQNSPPAAAGSVGITVNELTDELREKLGLKDDVDGVVVVQVAPGGMAWEAGIRPGDLVVSANNKAIGDLDDFRVLVNEGTLDSGVRLALLRQGMHRFVFLKK